MKRLLRLSLRFSRLNLILVAVLIIQLVLTIVVFLPTSSASVQAGGPLLSDFKPEAVTTITIHDKDKNELDLAQNASGAWVLPKADDYPVTATRVSDLLNKLKALDTSRLIAQSTSSQNRLSVAPDNYERLVEIKQGSRTDRLYIGSSAGTNATNMRLNDQNQIYLTSGLASTDISTSASSWIQTPYFSVTQNDIEKLTVKNAQGTFDLARVNTAWALNGLQANEQFNPDSVTRLLTQVSSINVDAPLGKTAQDRYHMNSPLATITITTLSQRTGAATQAPNLSLAAGPTATPPVAQPVEKTYTLTIGAKLDNGDYVLKSSDSPYYIQVVAGVAETFVNLKRADLLNAATPAATAQATVPVTEAVGTSAATPAATLPATASASAPAATPAAGTPAATDAGK